MKKKQKTHQRKAKIQRNLAKKILLSKAEKDIYDFEEDEIQVCLQHHVLKVDKLAAKEKVDFIHSYANHVYFFLKNENSSLVAVAKFISKVYVDQDDYLRRVYIRKLHHSVYVDDKTKKIPVKDMDTMIDLIK